MSTTPPEQSAADPSTAPAEVPEHPFATRWNAADDHLAVRVWSDGVVLVTLSQPERRNAMSDRMTTA